MAVTERAADERDAATQAVVDRLEGFVSYGAPTCDVCYQLHQDERPDEGEFYPKPAIHYIRGTDRMAVDFWGVTVCEHHDVPQYRPGDATHRVEDEPEFIGREHRMNSAYAHHVIAIEEVSD